jgi:hypothetical protein
MVGAPGEEGLTRGEVPGLASLIIWSPMLCETAGGDPYALHVFHQQHALGGDLVRVSSQGGVEGPDGRREPFVAIVPELEFDAVNRRLLGGILRCTTADGSERPLTLTSLGDTGFHLGAGLYFGFDDQWHGQYRGRLHVDGEHVADCTTVDAAHRLHQLRDGIVGVDDPVGGGTGWANAQTMVTGPHPTLGLTEDTSFV